MTRHTQKFALAAVVLCLAMGAFAQPLEFTTFTNGVTYYYDHSRRVIGSSTCRLGLEEFSYSTDAAGSIITAWPNGRAKLPGETFHRRTRIFLGPVSLAVPLRSDTLATIGKVLVTIGKVLVLASVLGIVISVLRRAYSLREDRHGKA